MLRMRERHIEEQGRADHECESGRFHGDDGTGNRAFSPCERWVRLCAKVQVNHFRLSKGKKAVSREPDAQIVRLVTMAIIEKQCKGGKSECRDA
jgi:hypothetical protein